MQQKLLLTSDGLSTTEIIEELYDLLPKDVEQTLIGYIPNAGDLESHREYIDSTRGFLRNLGFVVLDINLKNLKGEELKKELEEVDVIYVQGGNTYYLIDIMRKSGFDKTIQEMLDKGKIYVGASAGSIVAGPNAESADENVVGIKDMGGLGIVPFSVFPHYEEKSTSILDRVQKKADYPVIALTDAQAVVVVGAKIKYLGKPEKRALPV